MAHHFTVAPKRRSVSAQSLPVLAPQKRQNFTPAPMHTRAFCPHFVRARGHAGALQPGGVEEISGILLPME
jgi:hypothetical protein